MSESVQTENNLTPDDRIQMITGAFGYSGKYIANLLLDAGYTVHTLTNSVNRENIFKGKVTIHPFDFDNPKKLVESLKGVSVLYNTYWVRFNHKTFTHADAVNNTKILFECAAEAKVERIVHVSITNPEIDSPLEYFKGKAELEKSLIESGMSFAILRPAVIFGKEDILINNIAWTLRKFPIFGVFGDGQYKIQPVYVEDLARLAVKAGSLEGNMIVDAVGPESFTYIQLAETIGEIIGKRRPVISIPPDIGYIIAKIVGWIVGDVFVTREEIKGLMAGTLAVDSKPSGQTLLTEWAKKHSKTLGMKYTSELARRRDRKSCYKSN